MPNGRTRALARQCPAARHSTSIRPYHGLPEIAYPLHDCEVLVTDCSLHRKRVNISSLLAGQKSTRAFGLPAFSITISATSTSGRSRLRPTLSILPGMGDRSLGSGWSRTPFDPGLRVAFGKLATPCSPWRRPSLSAFYRGLNIPPDKSRLFDAPGDRRSAPVPRAYQDRIPMNSRFRLVPQPMLCNLQRAKT
jgi:hypothetical protein